MEKLNLHSPDFIEANIAKLAELFPNCVTEVKDEGGRLKDEMGAENSSFSPQPSSLKYAIDFDQLRQELSTSIVEGAQERYQLNWPGKREALLTANAPIAKTLRPCREESIDFDSTQNLYIEGDNLDALKLLQETYLGKVKMIYIDPPYNTGNDFIYKDDFAEDTASYLQRSNQKDDVGNRMVANIEANGRFHSDWLSMMYSRLKLARNLLNDDGVIFVSIGDHEVNNLRALLNEIFGEGNYINTICVKAKPSAGASGGGEDKRLKKNVEFLIMYSKNRESEDALDINQAFDETELSEHICSMREEGKSWKYTRAVSNFGIREKLQSIEDGDGNEITIFRHNDYKFSRISELTRTDETEADTYLHNFETVFRDTNAQSSIRTRVMRALGEEDGLFSIDYIPRSGRSKGKLLTVYYKGPNKDQLAWLRDIAVKDNNTVKIRGKTGTLWADFNWNNVSKEGDFVFPNGKKPIAFIQRMLELATKHNKNHIVLDFFAGSCSSAHAVTSLNLKDGGNRKFIMVQLPEACDEKSEAYKAGYKTVAEIGKERIRRAGKKIKSENAEKDGIDQLDIGFRVLKIDSSNMKDVYYTPDKVDQNDLFNWVDNIRENRTAEDLLFQVLLDWGVDLTLPITQETIAGKSVLFVDDNALAACFDEAINEDFVKVLAARQPLRVVFRDAGFSSDSVKINIEQIFKLISPGTEIKTL